MSQQQIRPDAIIEELGGCGKYQWRLNILLHVLKTIVCFSTTSMVIMSATPTWYCADDITCQNTSALFKPLNFSESGALSTASEHLTSTVESETVVPMAPYDSNMPKICGEKQCLNGNNTPCNSFKFLGDANTFVSEFGLVCDKDFVASTIMTIQVAGMLVGNFVSGQLGDLFGRKPPFITSIVFILSANILGYFSTGWIMFAVARFIIGLGASCFMTMKYSLLSEFSLAKWRVWIIGFPSWPVEACIFAFLAWVIKDWRYIQLMIALLSVPCLISWWFIPESFRWYIANEHQQKAKVVLKAVAKCNGKMDNIDNVDHFLVKPKDVDTKRYTFIDLLKTRSLIKVLFLSSLNWAALGLVSYGISFGVQALSGSLYFNVFLFSLVGIPSKFIALWLQNKFGRRWTTILCHIIVVVGGVVVGVVQTIDAENKDSLTNIFALIAYIGITTAWGPIQTMTIELFPTVVRAVGFGFLSVFGRIAAMIGPQLVYANLYLPGILYYVCAGWCALCILACFCLPETMGGNLHDKLDETEKKVNLVGVQKNNVV